MAEAGEQVYQWKGLNASEEGLVAAKALWQSPLSNQKICNNCMGGRVVEESTEGLGASKEGL